MRGSSNSSPDRPLRLVLLGAPGAGKGTQSQLLCARLHIPHISTGDLLREAQNAGTRLGRVASDFIDKGELVPDEVITAVVEQRLRSSGQDTGFALDGFPRTIPQADRLEVIVRYLGGHLSGVLFYKVPEEELIRRLSGRRVCDGCGRIYHFSSDDKTADAPCATCGGHLYRREDDSPDAIRTRFKLYHEWTQPLVEYYSERRLLFPIDATGEIEEIYLRSMKALGISA